MKITLLMNRVVNNVLTKIANIYYFLDSGADSHMERADKLLTIRKHN